ncbi:MAG TPA: IMP dehydrogenase [Candidatus Saccharimonadales bacterium]|nr:IMP dehydrogenase [Candidatus Saccharimonadales bacterium]
MEHNLPLALTFDDVLLRPGYSGFDRKDITLTTNLTKNIQIKTPIVAAPMDTVAESGLAIVLAHLGGIAFIHRNLTIEDQVAEVSKVKKEQLLVGAAVGSSAGYEKRVEALAKAGVDVLIVDSAHGYSKKVIEAVKYIKQNYKVDVIAGNVATADGAQALIDAGADGLRVGMGPGAICSTRIISGMGVPQLTALFETCAVAKKHAVPVIADGGIARSGDIVKALAAGASTVMLGRLLAATEEAPGKVTKLKPEQVPSRFQNILDGSTEYTFKEYRGMGSIAAMKQGLKISSEDEFHGKDYQGDTLVAEGVEGLVPCSGTVKQVIDQLIGGVFSGMYYIGARTIGELWETAVFTRITQASLSESHPHDLFITNPGDNYK